MNKAYISFGSNIGDRRKAVADALTLLRERGIKITGESNLIETEPYGYTDQPVFLNGALEIETELSCRELLKVLLSVETELGRVREFKWGPRIIDLDIVFFNHDIYDEKDLKVPHPDMHNREFVLKPLNDICPDYVHPVLKKSVSEMLGDIENKGQGKK